MKKNSISKDVSELSRRDFLVVGSGAVVTAAFPLGCGEEKGSSSELVPSADPGAVGTKWADKRKILDLMDSLHMADVFHYGEFVDFGTAARFKYSMGGWMSGFDNDTSMNGVEFTWATTSPSRLYFSLEEATALTFEFRVKKGGSDFFSIYLNDNPLQRITMKGDDWETHRVTSTAEQCKAGENYFKLIYQTTDSKVGGNAASFAIDYMRIIPDGTQTPEQFDPPHLTGMRQLYKVKDRERESIILVAPTTLSYYLEVPSDAFLCFAASRVIGQSGDKAGAGEVSVRMVPVDGGTPVEALSGKYDKGEWVEEVVDMAPMAGKLARIDITANGAPGSRIAIGEPAIRVKQPAVEIPAGRPKNVIVLLIDTLRADKLASYGNNRVKSSAFQKFAQEGTLFEDCQANSNWTKPSCASVLTGLHPDSHKARGHSSRLAKSVKMASEIFRKIGFSTGAFIANGYLAAEFGFKRGWNTYVNYIRENKNTDAENVFKETLAFIESQAGKPFFAYVQTIDPHVPYDPPAEDLKMYDALAYEGPVQPRSTGNLLEEFKRKKVELNGRDRRRLEALYDGEITYHDRHFGHFLDGLNKLGVLNDTAIIVCSDHGEEFFDHESVGHGHTLFQELLHVPLVVRAPGLVPGGKKIKGPVCLADILPTALTAVGQDVPKEIEGANLLAMANGEVKHPQGASFSSFFSEADDRNLQWCVRRGDWKMHMKGPVNTYVYNLADDPREKVDVDEKYPLALRALRISLGQFIGCPDKADWMSSQVAANVVVKPEAEEDKNENLPDDLKDQLRQLGYIQ